MRSRIRRRLIIPALVAMLSGALLVGPAQATAPPAVTGPAGGPIGPEEVDQAFDEESEGPSNCVGGQQKRSQARLNDQPVSGLQEELTFTELPGSRVVFNTNDTDQIMVTFSAEAQLQGQSDPMVAPVDFLQVRLVLDMMPMPPHNDLMFNTDGGGAHAIEACQRVPEGQHVLWVEYLLVDQGTADVLTGTLDDSTLHIEIND